MKTVTVLFFFGIILIFPQSTQAQLLTLSGYVKNFFTGEPIENAAIYEATSGIGTISNSDGYYKLLLQNGKQELKISSTGSESYYAKFNLVSDTIISVGLKPENFSKNSVVAGNKLKNDSVPGAGKPTSVRKRK